MYISLRLNESSEDENVSIDFIEWSFNVEIKLYDFFCNLLNNNFLAALGIEFPSEIWKKEILNRITKVKSLDILAEELAKEIDLIESESVSYGIENQKIYHEGDCEKIESIINELSEEYASIDNNKYYHLIDNVLLNRVNDLSQAERLIAYMFVFDKDIFSNYDMNSSYGFSIAYSRRNKNMGIENFLKVLYLASDGNLKNNNESIYVVYDAVRKYKNTFKMHKEYSFNSLEDCIKYIIYYMIEKNDFIKRCENCGKYFFPTSRSDEIYCDNIFKNNKTCKQLGYEIKLNQDEILKPYRTIYKTQNARKQRNKHKTNIDERFSKWSEYAHSVLKRCQDGEITVEEMKELISGNEWLNDNEV